MGLFEFFNKPNPQEIAKKLNEAIAKAEAFNAKDDKVNALNALLECKKIGWDSSIYLLHLGLAYNRNENTTEAVKCFERSIQLNPNNAISYTHLGYVYFNMREFEKALPLYEKGRHIMEANMNNYPKNDYLIICARYGASLAGTGNKKDGEFYIKKAESEGYQNGDALRQFVGLPVSTKNTSETVSSDKQETPVADQKRDLIKELALLIRDTIPEEWSIVYFYGEVLWDSRTAYFFYRRTSDNKLIYSHDIPEECNVDKKIYDKQLIKIWHCLADLNSEYASNFENVWTNLTLILESNGKFNIKYNYEDVYNCGYFSIERQKIWMYEVMGIEPKDEEGKALIQRYLESKKESKNSSKLLISKYGNGSKEIVEEFEKKYGLSLDEEYKTFLVKYNGGDTPETGVKSSGFSSDLRYLFGLNEKNSIEDSMSIPAWQDKKCLPIGEDSFGNYFVMGTSQDNKGNIFFSDHEKGFALQKIADSFGQFLTICKSDEIHPGAKMPPEEREASLTAEGKAGNITDGLREIWKQEYEKYKNMTREEVILSSDPIEEGKRLYKAYKGKGFHCSREESPEKYALFKAVKQNEQMVRELDKEILEDLFSVLQDWDENTWIKVGQVIDMLFHDTVDREYWGSKLLDEIEKMDGLDHKNKVLIIERMIGDDREHKKGGIYLFCAYTHQGNRMNEIMKKFMDFTCDEDEIWMVCGINRGRVSDRHNRAVMNYGKTYSNFMNIEPVV